MKTVTELAREAGVLACGHSIDPDEIAAAQRFHDLAIAQYRESLLAGVGEPHYWTQRLEDDTVNMVPFYYPDQLATAVAIERDKAVKLWMLLDDVDTADDIAKADDKLYRGLCQQYQKQRWDILSVDEVDAAAIRGQR